MMMIILSSLMSVLVCADLAPLQTVPSVDLNRYLGQWHEIARLPNFFQKHCGKSTAQYSLREDGKIEVLNKCSVLGKDSVDEALGLAQVADTETNAKLEVSFLPGWIRWTGIGSGDYWIIELGQSYEYAVVSEPGRKYLWILSRSPKMDPKVYEAILSRLRERGFDTSKLVSF